MAIGKRPFSIADIFVGGDKLRDLHELVGQVVTSLGGVEDNLRYLRWQLMAFDLAEPRLAKGDSKNDIQRDLDTKRIEYLKKYSRLKVILDGISKALRAPTVATALGPDATAIEKEWQHLSAVALDLGNRRNALAHSVVALSGGSPVRSAGLFGKPEPLDPATVRDLTRDIGAFYSVLGEFINKLTRRLPFRDHNQITFAS